MNHQSNGPTAGTRGHRRRRPRGRRPLRRRHGSTGRLHLPRCPVRTCRDGKLTVGVGKLRRLAGAWPRLQRIRFRARRVSGRDGPGLWNARRLLTLVDSRVGAGIDAVMITHKHPDHMLDLHGLFRARWFGDRDADPIPLYAPDGVVQRLQGLEEDDEGAILEVFDWHPLPVERPYDLGPFQLRSRSLPHFVLAQRRRPAHR